MKIKTTIILIIALFVFGCQQDEPIPYKPTKQDSLSFLVSNSDLIAVIEIFDGLPRGPNTNSSLQEEVSASIQKTISWQGPELKTIKIHYEPFHKTEGAVFAFMFLRNGSYLAFLKDVGNNSFKPTTGNSLLAIFGAEERVQPVWKKGLGNEEELSKGYKLAQIIGEITKEQNKGI